METLIFIALSLVASALIFAVLIVLAYQAAKHDQQATFVPEGCIRYVVSGETLRKTLPNIKDHHMEMIKGVWRIVDDDKDKKPQTNWWEKEWGFFWVSILYPWKKVHSFEISKVRLKAEDKRTGTKIREWLDFDQNACVKELLWRIPRYILVEDVEFQDRLKADILVFMLFETVLPYIPVFVLKGKFFPVLEAAARSKVIDIASKTTFAKFVAETKKSSGSEITDELLKINGSNGIGAVGETGIKAIDGFIVEFESADSDDVQKSLRATEIAQLEGTAKVMEATKRAEAAIKTAEATVTIATAEAEAAKLKKNAVGENIRLQELQSEAVREFKGSTLVLGGGKFGVNINAKDKEEK